MNAAKEIADVLDSACREGGDWRCRCPTHGGCGEDELVGNHYVACPCAKVIAEFRRVGPFSAGAGKASDSVPRRLCEVFTPKVHDLVDSSGHFILATRPRARVGA